MKESFEQAASQEKNRIEYDSLKEDLRKGSISFGEAEEKLEELDQLTPLRDASEENLTFLYDPEIIEYVREHPESKEEYNGFLSFTEFHVAQRSVSDNSEVAAEHFKKALESARKDTRFGESWASYVEGTLMYIDGKEIPEEIQAKVDEQRNADILRNFNAGLKERGVPSYWEDYSK